MRFLWVTRGRRWGFRFLRNGGYEDPLPVYEAAFSGIGNEPAVFQRYEEKIALRFPDPEGRKDKAGRIIPHNFVILDAVGSGIDSLEDGLRLVWPLVAHEYADMWESTPGQ